jgi:phage protein D
MTGVTYSLFVDEAPAGSDLMTAVQQVEVEDSLDMASMLRLRIAVGVRDDRSGWTVVDDDTFARLTKIRLDVALGSAAAETLMSAYVIDSSVMFSNQPGQSVLEVVAMDSTVLMNLEEKVRSWPNMADSDIASKIFSEHNLAPQVDSTQPSRQEDDVVTIQRGSDIQFLRFLAQRNGFDCYVEADPQTHADTGYFRAPQLQNSPQGVLSINMGDRTNVNSFNARYNMLEPAQVAMSGVNIEDQTTQQANVQSSSYNLLGPDGVLSNDRPRQRLEAQAGLFQSGELQTYSQGVTDHSTWAVSAEGELNTVAYENLLRAKRTVLVRGAGSAFSGTYFVQRVLHTFTGSGYTQRFTLARNALGLTGSEDFSITG